MTQEQQETNVAELVPTDQAPQAPVPVAPAMTDLSAAGPAMATQLLLNPVHFEQLERQAHILAASNVVPQNRPADVIAVALFGLEIGVSPVRACQGMVAIEGTITIRGEFALALIRARAPGATMKLLEATPERAAWLMARPGEDPQEFTFTTEDAKRANLLGKDNWKRYPDRMLQWRALGKGVRVLFSDVLNGAYITEEMDSERPSGRETGAQQPKQQPKQKPKQQSDSVLPDGHPLLVAANKEMGLLVPEWRAKNPDKYQDKNDAEVGAALLHKVCKEAGCPDMKPNEAQARDVLAKIQARRKELKGNG